jgi:hypothetical protein
MKRMKLFSMVFTPIFVLGVLGVTIAKAVEPTKILPAGVTSFKIKSGPRTLTTVNGTEISFCKNTIGSGLIPTLNLGTYFLELKGCQFLGFACTGEGDSSGVVLLLATFHYWLALLSTSLVAAFVFLIAQFSFTCAGGLVSMRGCIAALAEPTETLTTITRGVFRDTSRGISDIRTVLPQNATKGIACKLEADGGGGFEEAAEIGTIEFEKFEQLSAAIKVLLMNK